MENHITKLDIAFEQDFVACCEQLAGQERTVMVFDDWFPQWIESGQMVVTTMTWLALFEHHQRQKLSQTSSE